MLGAKVGIYAPGLNPVVSDDAYITLAKKSFAQHLNTMIDMSADNGLGVRKALWPILRLVVVLLVCVLADDVLILRLEYSEY